MTKGEVFILINFRIFGYPKAGDRTRTDDIQLWKADVLPLNYTRSGGGVSQHILHTDEHIIRER